MHVFNPAEKFYIVVYNTVFQMDQKSKSRIFNEDGKKRIIIIGNTLLLFIPVFLIILTITILILDRQEKMEKQVYSDAEYSIVDVKLKSIETELNHVLHDLFTLKSNSLFNQYINDNDPNLANELSEDFLNIAMHQRSYDQCRFINEKGIEVIRINFNNGNPYIVPNSSLQNKRNRYYFQETIKLSENEVYISPLDLNIENGEVEEPFKPMIRIGTPIFNKSNKNKGILLFNFLAEDFLLQMEAYKNTMLQNQIMVLNSDGYWLKSPVKEHEWGFMFENKKDIYFSNYYSDAWDNITNNETIQFETKCGLFTSKTIYPAQVGLKYIHDLYTTEFKEGQLLQSKKYYWKIVSFVPNEVLYEEQNHRRKLISIILGLFSISLLFMSGSLAKNRFLKNEALKSLKLSNDTKDKFFSIIAHDLKGPFNSLIGFSDLLLEEIKSNNKANIKKFSTILHTTINNTYDFIINLLDWSRSQTNAIVYRPEIFNINDLILENFRLLKPQADKKNIVLINLTSEDFNIQADKNILSTIFRNLISNAIKYSNPGGEVKVEANWSNSFVKCLVKDNGIGMSNERLSELFKLESTKSTPGTNNEKGTGLGLILCKELIENNQGTFKVDSEVGKGSSFWFTLPIG